MSVGISKIGFFAPDEYISLAELAEQRGVEPGKYLIGIGQERQAVIPLSQDVVSMAANAAKTILDDEDRSSIDMILFGTETGVDNSKSAAIYLQQLLHLNSNIRTVELKQACYGATAGLLLAKDYVTLHPDKKVLVIGADIARYGLNTAGEVTQGGGAIAMIVSANPQILAIEDQTVHLSEDIMDFWRPLDRREAIVDGKYSTEVYLRFFQTVFEEYKTKTSLKLNDFGALVFHLPFTKMGLKALKLVLNQVDEENQEKLLSEFENSRRYNRQVGNLYTGSLYLSLLSLLDNTKLSEGARIGLFSYGSGAEGEFYSGLLQKNYKNHLNIARMTEWLEQRKKISIAQYEEVFNQALPKGEEDFNIKSNVKKGQFYFAGLKDQKRIYRAK